MARKTTPTHVLLNQIELSSSTSSVTFSNIPQGYGDLVLELNTTGSDAAAFLYVFLNGDSSNYSRVFLYTGGTLGAGSASNAGFHVIYGTIKRQTNTIELLDYSAVDKHKFLMAYMGNANHGELALQAVRWANTDPVSSIVFEAATGTISPDSTFRLYGVYA